MYGAKAQPGVEVSPQSLSGCLPGSRVLCCVGSRHIMISIVQIRAHKKNTCLLGLHFSGWLPVGNCGQTFSDLVSGHDLKLGHCKR